MFSLSVIQKPVSSQRLNVAGVDPKGVACGLIWGFILPVSLVGNPVRVVVVCGFQSFALQLFSKNVLLFCHGNLVNFILTVDFDDSLHLDGKKTKFARTLTDALPLVVPHTSVAPNRSTPPLQGLEKLFFGFLTKWR